MEDVWEMGRSVILVGRKLAGLLHDEAAIVDGAVLILRLQTLFNCNSLGADEILEESEDNMMVKLNCLSLDENF